MDVIEQVAKFDEEGNAILKLGKKFSKKNAKVVVLIKDDEINENEWLSFAMDSGSFNFLKDSVKDIYTMEDGKPYKTKE